jgi:hypothetical protein
MSERVSQIILLCEDETHERLTKAYLKACGHKNPERFVRSLVASRMQHGGNVGWVLDEFPKQLHACRQRQKKARTLLIVLVDADKLTVEARRRQLLGRVKSAGLEEFGKSEPAAILIPKRHIETWVSALLGDAVTETEDCKIRRKLRKEEIRRAAETLDEWSRPNATPGTTCVPSLLEALPEWNKIRAV